MNDTKLAAAILTLALWNSRQKSEVKADFASLGDWKNVMEDYKKIYSALTPSPHS